METKNIQVEMKENGSGNISAINDGEEMGFIEIGRETGFVTAFHTEVYPAGEGQGWGKQLFKALVDYARENKLQITPLCPFVHAQLKRGTDEYKDVWRG